MEERLKDIPRAGKPSAITAEQLCQIVALACELPEASGRPITQWSPRELAAQIVGRGILSAIFHPAMPPVCSKKGSPGSLPQRPPTAPGARLADSEARRAF
ncbi:helix-turn-helix domain-containing protein [Gloeobacter violaceus]|uniref:helix-turn-helix domain-containing protein n=1 Tax=Gloeobacter violaceus TaxID=33072 RepID=UPI0038B32ABF